MALPDFKNMSITEILNTLLENAGLIKKGEKQGGDLYQHIFSIHPRDTNVGKTNVPYQTFADYRAGPATPKKVVTWNDLAPKPHIGGRGADHKTNPWLQMTISNDQAENLLSSISAMERKRLMEGRWDQNRMYYKGGDGVFGKNPILGNLTGIKKDEQILIISGDNHISRNVLSNINAALGNAVVSRRPDRLRMTLENDAVIYAMSDQDIEWDRHRALVFSRVIIHPTSRLPDYKREEIYQRADIFRSRREKEETEKTKIDGDYVRVTTIKCEEGIAKNTKVVLSDGQELKCKSITWTARPGEMATAHIEVEGVALEALEQPTGFYLLPPEWLPEKTKKADVRRRKEYYVPRFSFHEGAKITCEGCDSELYIGPQQEHMMGSKGYAYHYCENCKAMIKFIGKGSKDPKPHWIIDSTEKDEEE